MLIKSKPCPGCKRIIELEVSQEQLNNYNSGTLIQKAFPHLSNSERESLITGYCDPCWKKLFSDGSGQ